MSIKVTNITKIYGQQKALENVSFETKKGEITGFLGPNGAGKSTMMKILTCYIPATSGQAWVENFDTLEQSIEVRRNVGYLPEHNPLYHDMYVKEYLTFVAGMLMPSAKIESRVNEMVEITGLLPEVKKKIGALSKGYRQRVGLAQAMIHNPKVLILDEPTSGLDPNQLIEIRSLIKNIGKEKTVLLSTHIMQEVTAICNRVIIINKGKIVADDNVSILQEKTKGENVVHVEFEKQVHTEDLRRLKGVLRVEVLGENKFNIHADRSVDVRNDVFKYAVDKHNTVLAMQKVERNLEEIFHQLTRN